MSVSRNQKMQSHQLIKTFFVLLCTSSLNIEVISQRASTPRGTVAASITSLYDTLYSESTSTPRTSSGFTNSENNYNGNDFVFTAENERRTTRRPSSNLESSTRNSFTTRRPSSDDRSSTRRPSQASFPTPRPEDRVQARPPQLAPNVNLTAEDFNGELIDVEWYRYLWNGSYVQETSLNIRGLRKLILTFTCNDTYPIKWLSRRSFFTSKAVERSEWKMDELRHFTTTYDHHGRERVDVTYTMILRLTYDKEEIIPPLQELHCARVQADEFARTKQSVIEVKRMENSTLAFKITPNLPLSLKEIEDGGKLQYSELLGSNVDCFQKLVWKESSRIFECTADANSGNLTINAVFDNCEDPVSCERRFTSPSARCWNSWSRTRVESKGPMDFWTREPPPSGVIFCNRQSEPWENRTAALPFYHSLPAICPDDNSFSRRQLYIPTGKLPRDDVLRRDFMSICALKDASGTGTFAMSTSENENIAKYVGENMTVSCFASWYHFAEGARIGLVAQDGSDFRSPVIAELTTTPNRNKGYFNYTAKVLIPDTNVARIYCENYIKQTNRSLRTSLPIFVKIPIPPTFIGGSFQREVWNYSGQTGFELSCGADGDPKPIIAWRRQNQEMSHLIQTITKANGSYSSLIFPSLETSRWFDFKQLHGIYICAAVNRLRTIERNFEVSLATLNNSKVTVVNVVSNGTAIPIKKADGGGGSLWWVWAIIVPLVIILFLAVVGLLVWKIKIQSRELSLLSKAEVDEFNFGKPDFLQHHSSTEEVNNYAAYLPYNKGYEVGKEQIEIDPNAILGSGAYAIVLKGLLRQSKGGDVIPVAIKTAKPMDDVSFFKALLSELKIMGFIGTHQNIVNLVGAYTRNIQNREIFIAIEFCERGNLLSYLRDNRHRFTSQVNEDYEFPQNVDISRDSFVYPDREGLSTITLLKWSQEIASGMDFLGQRKVVHGDLAARNILLTEHLVAKIGDFGLSRQLFEYANYIKKQQSPLPWKWLAIECLQDMKFSVKSDVWAYAIILYEIFSLGQVPYPGHSYNDEFLDALVSGKRPNKPSYATNNIYQLISKCWQDNANERPSFIFIQQFFMKILAELVPQEYIDLHEQITKGKSLPRSVDASSTSGGSGTGSLTRPVGENEKKEFSFNINPKTITAAFKIKSIDNP